MRKFLLTLGLMVASATFAPAIWAFGPNDIIQLAYQAPGIDTEKDRPRTPVYVPQVGQEGYTLYFYDETDFTVNLYSVDEDGDRTLEYTTFVPATTESITLPSNLSGTYVIEVVRGSQHFEGEIEL